MNIYFQAPGNCEAITIMDEQNGRQFIRPGEKRFALQQHNLKTKLYRHYE